MRLIIDLLSKCRVLWVWRILAGLAVLSLSIGVRASTLYSYEYHDYVMVTVVCTSYCTLKRKNSNGTVVTVDTFNPNKKQVTLQIDGLPQGEYEYSLESQGYGSGGWGVVEVDYATVVISTPVYRTIFQYDELGRLKKADRKGSKATSYEYDNADNRKRKIIN